MNILWKKECLQSSLVWPVRQCQAYIFFGWVSNERQVSFNPSWHWSPSVAAKRKLLLPVLPAKWSSWHMIFSLTEKGLIGADSWFVFELLNLFDNSCMNMHCWHAFKDILGGSPYPTSHYTYVNVFFCLSTGTLQHVFLFGRHASCWINWCVSRSCQVLRGGIRRCLLWSRVWICGCVHHTVHSQCPSDRAPLHLHVQLPGVPGGWVFRHLQRLGVSVGQTPDKPNYSTSIIKSYYFTTHTTTNTTHFGDLKT